MTSGSINRVALIIIALVAVLCASWVIFGESLSVGECIAEISVDGEVVRRIDLREAEDGSFTLEEYGKNIVFEIKDGSIRFLSSDCPDKICVYTGFVKDSMHPAVCLPNRTAINLTSP